MNGIKGVIFATAFVAWLAYNAFSRPVEIQKMSENNQTKIAVQKTVSKL
jgi:hypothetical protein